MSLLIQYLVKLTISLAIVWLFYQFVLRRLTFYNSNRWYLIAYTLLSFLIPFINISSILENRPNDLIQLVPSVHQYTLELEEASQCPAPIWSTQYDKWDFISFGLIAVAGILFLRFVISYFSFLKIKNRAKLISNDGVIIYQVDQDIIPFSFGKSIFINTDLHSSEELEEIVKHEFVHVRQKHTIDIIWAELLTIINWYNPFAWLLKRSIRQNLEFVADNKVIQNGVNKKEYQYLLLKVIGNKQFSIATQFNFSSLKKRIAMMNKTKSAKRQLGRFFLLLPVFAIILLSFRQSFKQLPTEKRILQTVIPDTIPDVKKANSKGYYIDIKDNKGNCTVVVKDKNKKEVKRLLLTDWNAKKDHYTNLYGEILSPVKEEIVVEEPLTKLEEATIVEAPIATTKPDLAEVFVDGKPLIKSVATTTEVKAVNVIGKPVTTTIVTKPELREIVVAGQPLTVTTNSTVAPTIQGNVNAVSEARTTIAPMIAIEEPIRGEVDITITIKKTIKPEDLESLISKFKEKGYELRFTDKNFDNGILTELSGTVKYKGSSSTFSFSDFEQATIAVYREGDDVYFRVYTGKKRTAS
jgi:beta-lactamase regulating signal transducer with metallopeptidase domain